MWGLVAREQERAVGKGQVVAGLKRQGDAKRSRKSRSEEQKVYIAVAKTLDSSLGVVNRCETKSKSSIRRKGQAARNRHLPGSVK